MAHHIHMEYLLMINPIADRHITGTLTMAMVVLLHALSMTLLEAIRLHAPVIHLQTRCNHVPTSCRSLPSHGRSHWCSCQCKGCCQSYQPNNHELDDCGCSIASLALYAGISKQQVLGGSVENEVCVRSSDCVCSREKC